MATKVTALPLDDLITSTRKTPDAAGNFLQTDGIKSLPTSLGAALEAFAGTLAELRAGGAVANRDKVLVAARTATEAVAKATDKLPDLMARLDGTAQNLNRLIESDGPGSAIGRLAQDVLREMQRAAASVGSLVKMLERNPQSLRTGR